MRQFSGWFFQVPPIDFGNSCQSGGDEIPESWAPENPRIFQIYIWGFPYMWVPLVIIHFKRISLTKSIHKSSIYGNPHRYVYVWQTNRYGKLQFIDDLPGKACDVQ